MNGRCKLCGHTNDADAAQCDACGEILRPARDGLFQHLRDNSEERREELLNPSTSISLSPSPLAAFDKYRADDGPPRAPWQPGRMLVRWWLLAAAFAVLVGVALLGAGLIEINHGAALFDAGLWAFYGSGAILLAGVAVWGAIRCAFWLETKLPARKPRLDADADQPPYGRKRKVFAPRVEFSAKPAPLPDPTPAYSPPSYPAQQQQPIAERPHEVAFTAAGIILIWVSISFVVLSFFPFVGPIAIFVLIPLTVMSAAVLFAAHMMGKNRSAGALALAFCAVGLIVAFLQVYVFAAAVG